MTVSACLWLGLFPLLPAVLKKLPFDFEIPWFDPPFLQKFATYGTLTRDKWIIMFYLAAFTAVCFLADLVCRRVSRPRLLPLLCGAELLLWIVISCLASPYPGSPWWIGTGRREGLAQLTVGRHTDVLTGFPKAVGIELLLRAMTPTWIALDEITAPEDVAAMEQAAYCGVRFLATAHAARVEDLICRPLYRRLLNTAVFENVALIRPDRSIVCERMSNVLLQAGRGGTDPCCLHLGGISRRSSSASNP